MATQRADSTASMLAAAPTSVYKRFMEGGDNVPYVADFKVGGILGPNGFFF